MLIRSTLAGLSHHLRLPLLAPEPAARPPLRRAHGGDQWPGQRRSPAGTFWRPPWSTTGAVGIVGGGGQKHAKTATNFIGRFREVKRRSKMGRGYYRSWVATQQAKGCVEGLASKRTKALGFFCVDAVKHLPIFLGLVRGYGHQGLST